MENLRLFSSDNSFVNQNLFWRWVCEVFVPHVEEMRAYLRSKLGPFDDKAVLIMDGCSAHKIRGLEGFLAKKESW